MTAKIVNFPKPTVSEEIEICHFRVPRVVFEEDVEPPVPPRPGTGFVRLVEDEPPPPDRGDNAA